MQFTMRNNYGRIYEKSMQNISNREIINFISNRTISRILFSHACIERSLCTKCQLSPTVWNFMCVWNAKDMWPKQRNNPLTRNCLKIGWRWTDCSTLWWPLFRCVFLQLFEVLIHEQMESFIRKVSTVNGCGCSGTKPDQKHTFRRWYSHSFVVRTIYYYS